MDHTKYLLLDFIAVAIIGLVPETVVAAGEPVNLTATASQRLHPALIRNEHNALIQVVVDAKQPGIHVSAFTFSLRDTDDLQDLDSLRLFYSGNKRPRELDQIHSGINFSGDSNLVDLCVNIDDDYRLV